MRVLLQSGKGRLSSGSLKLEVWDNRFPHGRGQDSELARTVIDTIRLTK